MVLNYCCLDPQLIDRCKYNKTQLEKLFKKNKNNSFKIKQVWDGLHFVLSAGRRELTDIGKVKDLYGVAVMGNNGLFENDDLEDGAYRYVLPETVKEISLILENISDYEIEQNYDPELMDEMLVYPNNWLDSYEENLCLLKETFFELKDFYDRAAYEEKAVLIFMS